MTEVHVSLVKLPLTKCQWASLMICQNRFRLWFGAARQQAITWTNVDNVDDLCRHMVSLGDNELSHILMMMSSQTWIEYFVTKCAPVCTFLLQNGALWGICLVYCRIFDIYLLNLNTFSYLFFKKCAKGYPDSNIAQTVIADMVVTITGYSTGARNDSYTCIVLHGP